MIRIAVIQLETTQKKTCKPFITNIERKFSVWNEIWKVRRDSFAELRSVIKSRRLFFCYSPGLTSCTEVVNQKKFQFSVTRALKNRPGIAKVFNIVAESFRMQISRGKQSCVSWESWKCSFAVMLQLLNECICT